MSSLVSNTVANLVNLVIVAVTAFVAITLTLMYLDYVPAKLAQSLPVVNQYSSIDMVVSAFCFTIFISLLLTGIYIIFSKALIRK